MLENQPIDGYIRKLAHVYLYWKTCPCPILDEGFTGEEEHGAGQSAEEPGRVAVRVTAAGAAEGAAADPAQT